MDLKTLFWFLPCAFFIITSCNPISTKDKKFSNNLSIENEETHSLESDDFKRTKRSNLLCINKKDVLGERNSEEEITDIDCIPLTGSDKEQILQIENVLKSFPNDGKGESLDENNVIKFKKEKVHHDKNLKSLVSSEQPNNDVLKLEDDELYKVNNDTLGIFTTDLDQGSGDGEEESDSRNGDSLLKSKLKNFTNEIENSTDIPIAFAPPMFFEINEPNLAEAEQKLVKVGNFSSVVAGWAAGFFGTFMLIAIGAMCAKSKKKNKKKVSIDKSAKTKKLIQSDDDDDDDDEATV